MRPRAWAARLPQTTADLARRWSLRLSAPLHSGPVSWVAPAHTAAGQRVVLKVGWLHDEALHEADGLREWAGDGTVRLLDSCVTGAATALLLEACEPGTELAAALPEDERDVIIAGLLRRLWIEPSAGHPFRPLSRMCAAWADRFVADSAAARARGQDQLDPGIARPASSCSANFPAPLSSPSCSAPTCTITTCSPLGASRGSSSTPSPTSATPVTTSCSTC